MATRQNSTFECKFKPIIPDGAPEGGEYIPAQQFIADPRVSDEYLWTLIDPMIESGQQYFIPGFHVVNRVGYVYTEVPWTDADLADEYRRW